MGDLLRQVIENYRTVYFSICQQGYQVLRRTKEIPADAESYHWQAAPGFPPTYSASGRFRFLKTLQLALKLAPSRVLEVAAGGGFSAACLVNEGRQITVNDLRDLRSSLTHWVGGESIQFFGGDIFDLNPAQTGTFDVVMACDVIEHVAHGDRFVRHLKSFLKPGGWLLLTTPHGGYFRSRLLTHSQVTDFTELENRQFAPDADGHLYLYTRPEIEKLLREANFSEVHTELAVTPWLSGHCGLRYLPRGRATMRLYFEIDRLFSKIPALCSQMFTLAQY